MTTQPGNRKAAQLLSKEVFDFAKQQRHSIGRELHDALGQNFIGMIYLADELSEALAQPLDDSKREFCLAKAQALARLSRETNAITRNLAHSLALNPLKEGGLTRALQEMAQRCTSIHGVSCQTRCEDPGILPAQVAEHFFRIAQEAVTNALRHAKCSTVEIRLRKDRSKVRLSIADDGVGLGGACISKDGMGFRSMLERSKLMRASFSLGQAASGGLQVNLLWPAVAPEIG